jgi:excisionase family DNA binding protein
MPLTRQQVHGFVTDTDHLRSLGRARVVALLPDGRELPLPEGTASYLAEAYKVADRAGSSVPVAGDGQTVSAREAAQMLGVSRPTIYKWVEQGRLTEQRDTADHRIYTESIERILDQRRDQHHRLADELEERPDSEFSRSLLDEARALRAGLEA